MGARGSRGQAAAQVQVQGRGVLVGSLNAAEELQLFR